MNRDYIRTTPARPRNIREYLVPSLDKKGAALPSRNARYLVYLQTKYD
mgnify:CR=1 FL=1